MKQFPLALGTALAAFLLAAGAVDARPAVPISHPAPSQRLKWDSKKFMHVGELRPGMKGYALTVFKGTKITRFGVEILGVVSKFNEGKDYIAFRVLDGPVVTRHLEIAHGMSGSPIYIGGRLVGAISLGNQFAKDPIGYATPIEYMFDAWSPDLPAKPSSLSAAPPAAMSAGNVPLPNFSGSTLPLMASGLSAQSISRLNQAFSSFHFNVMAGGGAGDSTDTNPLAKGATLVPGSAVGVSLVQGDMDLTATGTVTYRDGNRLLLFGHPFTSLGPIDAALTTAYVIDVFPSYQDSTKIGAPIKTVGRIFQDRPFSVGGVIGPMPEMVPVTVSVNDESIKRRKDFHMRIINHPLLTGQLVSQMADAAIAQVHGQPGDSVAQVSFDVDVEEIGHVKRTNTFYDALSIDQAAIGDLDSLMHLLSSNSFYPLAVKSVQMSVTIQNRHDTAEIDHLFVKQSHFAPGDTVDVGVVMKPYKQPLYTRMVAVKIPLTTADGPLSLNVRGGGSEGGVTSLLGGLLQIRSAEPLGPAANIGQLVKAFSEKPRNNELVAHLLLPTAAVTVKGEKLSGLPPTLAAVMQSARTTGLRIERDEVKVTQTIPYIVTGSQTLNIMVRRKDLSETVRPTASSAGSAVPAGADPAPTADSGTLPMSSIGGEDGDFVMTLSPDSLATKPAPAPSKPGATVSDQTSAAASGTPAASAPAKAADTAAPASDDSTAAVKPVGRLPSIWRQDTMGEFAAGTLKNVAVTSLGDVRLSPSLQKVADTSESYIWSMLPDGKGNVYLGTGDGGVIYKMDAAGKAAPFFQTKELEVTSLALDNSGNLYAGTVPHGIVFKIGADGKGSKVFTAQEKYVTALAYNQAQDEVIVATGGGTGRVYSVGGHRFHLIGGGFLVPGRSSVVPPIPPVVTGPALFTSPEANILSVATDKQGNIYAGSGPNGIIYKITPDGKSSVLYDTPEPNVSALATDSLGNVYAGTSTTGTVYRIAPDGTAKRLLGRSMPGIQCLKTDANDAVYAVSGNTVYKINTDDSVQSFVADSDEQFLSLALDTAGSAVYAGTGTVGSIYKIGATGAGVLQGVFQSTVHDTGGRSHWGTIAWSANVPTGDEVALQTRSGDVERPDDSWSAWSASYTNAHGQTVTSPPARYLQYQALLSGVATGTAPRLHDVSVYYLPRNHAPIVGIVKPAGGDAVSKSTLLQWTGTDPDKDTLVYDAAYSADGGKTWKPITKRAAPDGAKPKHAAASLAASRANLDKQTNIPPAIRAKIIAQMKEAAAKEAAGATEDAKATAGATGLKDTSFTWDTSEVPDGTYQVRVTASDKPSNPTDALTAKTVSAPFLVVNAAPTLTVGTPVVNADKTVTLRGVVTTGLAFAKTVQAKVDGGDAVAASADDGLFDSSSEPFTLSLPALSSGKHTVEVQTLDMAGNSATQTVSITVP